MAWQSAVQTIIYYLFLPFFLLFRAGYSVLLVALAPLVYLLTYTFYALVLPVRILGRFETLYIYFGVAALIGILTGSILHFSSRFIGSVLNLQDVQEEESHPPVSLRTLQDRKTLEDAWDAATPVRSYAGRPRLKESLASEYAGLLKSDLGKKREGHGLLSQTILEEDDDSGDGF